MLLFMLLLYLKKKIKQLLLLSLSMQNKIGWYQLFLFLEKMRTFEYHWIRGTFSNRLFLHFKRMKREKTLHETTPLSHFGTQPNIWHRVQLDGFTFFSGGVGGLCCCWSDELLLRNGEKGKHFTAWELDHRHSLSFSVQVTFSCGLWQNILYKIAVWIKQLQVGFVLNNMGTTIFFNRQHSPVKTKLYFIE